MSGEFSTVKDNVKQQESNLLLDQPVIYLLNNQKRYGILRFRGKTEFSSGIWCGVELNEPCGKNDGAVANVRYFQCKEKHGIFVNSKNVFPVESEAVAKQVKRRVLPNVVQEAPDISHHNEDTLSNSENILEGRARSQSDNGLSNERIHQVNLFNDSPFRCDFGGKSSSLPKLNNDTYICHSPLNGTERDDLVQPKHSSPLAQIEQENLNKMEEKLRDAQQLVSHDQTVHHHVQLSPQLEVKQSIKLDRITKLSAPLGSVKRTEIGLNKTFLVRKQTPSFPKKIEMEESQCKKDEESAKKEIAAKQSSINENVNGTIVSVDESRSDDVTEVRSRSASKSSWSSVESLSSVGSSKERSRLKSTNTLTETSKKVSRKTDTSKSRLVKISAESKIKPKVTSKETPKTTQKSSISNTGSKTAMTDSVLKTKSRTKSTTIVNGGFKSVFDTPLSKKTAVPKPKSKSVSSEAALANCSGSTSKFSTPFASKGSIAPRTRLTSSRATPMSERKPKVNSIETVKKPAVPSTIPRGVSRDSNTTETRNLSKQMTKNDKRQVKQEENKSTVTRPRLMSTPANSNVKSSGVKSSSVKSSISRTTRPNGLREPRKAAETSEGQSVLRKKSSSQESSKKKDLTEKNSEKTKTSCLNSAITPDILKQTPEVTRHSVGVQVDDIETLNKVQSMTAMLSQRNRELEATLIALQLYSQKHDVANKKVVHLKNCVVSTKDEVLGAKKMIEKATSQRVRLEDEMLSVKSESVVELALLGVEYERKQELMYAKLMDDHKKSLEKAKKRNIKAMEEVKRSCDLKLKRVEETYVQDISEINEKHKDMMTELETQHSKVVEELIEERDAEIETIKADYEEQMEQLQERLSASNAECSKLAEKLKTEEEQSERDIEFRIQDAIAKYKTLPAELESMKFVLEMKNNETKKLRQSIGEYQNRIDGLERAKERAALLEREKESLHFVVENKAQFERQLSLERDKLRLSLDREVAASKRLSLENEELAWRLNTYQNSPTSPSFDKMSWRMQSGFSSPDSAVFSQRIEESEHESHMAETKETSS